MARKPITMAATVPELKAFGSFFSSSTESVCADRDDAVLSVPFVVVSVPGVDRVEVEATVVIVVITVEGALSLVLITGSVLPSVVSSEAGLSEEDVV